MRISMVEYKDASQEAKAEYDKQIASHGRITNMKKTLLHHLPSFRVLMEWYPLRDEVVQLIGEFATNVFCYAISSENDCLICSTFFRKILKDNGKDPDMLVLSDTEKLLVEYGRACVKKPTVVSDELFNRMNAVFDEAQLVLLTSFAGMMIATNLVNNAFQVKLDDYLTEYTKR